MNAKRWRAQRWWLLAAALLMIASAAVLSWLAMPESIASELRDPLSVSVEPGVAVWWFALGGPFRTGPISSADIAFAAAANAALVVGTIACLFALRRKLRRS